MEGDVPSMWPYEDISDAVFKYQEGRPGVVILENPDGSITYLHYNLEDEIRIKELLRKAYIKYHKEIGK